MVIVPLLKLPSLYFKGPCLGDGRNRPLCRIAKNEPHPGDRKPSWTCCLGRAACGDGGQGQLGALKGRHVAGAWTWNIMDSGDLE